MFVSIAIIVILFAVTVASVFGVGLTDSRDTDYTLFR
jgi:hypothetical protein